MEIDSNSKYSTMNDENGEWHFYDDRKWSFWTQNYYMHINKIKHFNMDHFQYNLMSEGALSVSLFYSSLLAAARYLLFIIIQYMHMYFSMEEMTF